jgi:hypothetical protein
MAQDLFGAATGPGLDRPSSGAPGSDEYQQNIVNRTTRSLKPAYQSAMRGLDQQFASRGLQDSGLAGEAQMGLSQDYLDRLAGVSEDAATRGADVGEENRRRLEGRGWDVEDRNVKMDWLRQQSQEARDAAAQAQWADLLGGLAGAAGSYVAGPIGGSLAGGAARSALTPDQEYAMSMQLPDGSY